MTDNGPRPGETVEEWRERLRCLASTSTQFALRHRDDAPLGRGELAEHSGIPVEDIDDEDEDEDEADARVGFRFMCGDEP